MQRATEPVTPRRASSAWARGRMCPSSRAKKPPTTMTRGLKSRTRVAEPRPSQRPTSARAWSTWGSPWARRRSISLRPLLGVADDAVARPVGVVGGDHADQRGQADLGLPAADPAAAAALAGGVDHHVAHFTGEAVGAAEEASAGDDAAADADLTGQVDHVGRAGGHAVGVFGQRRQVRVVGDGDRDAGATSQRRSATGTPYQPRFGATWTTPLVPSARPGTATVMPATRTPSMCSSAIASRAHPGQLVERGLGSQPIASKPDAPVDQDAARQVGGEGGDVVDVDLQPEGADTGAVEGQRQAGAADGAGVLGAHLADEAAGLLTHRRGW